MSDLTGLRKKGNTKLIKTELFTVEFVHKHRRKKEKNYIPPIPDSYNGCVNIA